MVLTPDSAQKIIKRFEEEKRLLQDKINKYSTYIVAVTEDPETLRPDFDLVVVVAEIEKLDDKIRAVRHARNIFNVKTIVPDIGLTVDECLVKMATLQREYSRFTAMGNVQEKERVSQYGGTQNREIEYKYVNYDIKYAKQLGEDMYNQMLLIQEKLNLVNSTYTFEVDIVM